MLLGGITVICFNFERFHLHVILAIHVLSYTVYNFSQIADQNIELSLFIFPNRESQNNM